jgi:proteasome accessory factor B
VGQFEHGWYVVGFDIERQAIRNFALQRLSELKPTAARFTRPPDFDARQYLSGGFGVWGYDGHGTQQHEVQIEFTDWAARFVAERRWHATQEIEELEDAVPRIRFRATVCGLEEITRWVLSWGNKARVLAPQEFAVRVEAELRGALGFYRAVG